jgi:hypothetical protein
MPDTTTTAAPSHRASFTEALMNPEAILKAVERFGLPLVMLTVILWWAKNDIVMPLLQAHFEVVQQIVTGQREHSDRLEKIGEKLDELIRVSK